MKPTRDEILSEPAGERLDAWVAEFVKHDVPGQVWTRPYSTEMAHAWEVVEKIRRGYCCVVVALDYHYRSTITIRHSPLGTAPLSGDHPVMAEVDVDGAETPLGICRAALLAVLDEG